MTFRPFLFVAFIAIVTTGQSSFSSEAVSVNVLPSQVLIQQDRGVQFLHFDFQLKNVSGVPLTLSRVATIYDKADLIVSTRRVDTNGASPSIATTTVSSLQPNSVVTLFNPFYNFPVSFQIAKVAYRFSFNDAQGKTYSTELSVMPLIYRPKSPLQVPLKGRFIVDDGNDFYSHHRRLDLQFPIIKSMGIEGNFSRYAYDLVAVNSRGQKYAGDGLKKEDWYGYGIDVLSPANGKVVAFENSLQENSPEYSGCKVAFDKKDSALLAGNHIIIDHGNNEFSLLGHLKTGSVRVALGETVKKAQIIGQIGFSGCTSLVHLHYELRNGAEFKTAEGLPSYFSNFTRIMGLKSESVRSGTFNTGDFVETN